MGRRRELKGLRAVVTGASQGIGRALALEGARRGMVIIAQARSRNLLDTLAGESEGLPGKVITEVGDVTCAADRERLVRRCQNEVGGLDILVNNAGRSIRRPLADSLDRWHDVERTMMLNYYSPLRLIRGLAPGMIERRDGHIINVATWGVLSEAPPLFSVYNASKAALSTVSRVIETEWSRHGVHSTTLYYPLVATPMIAPTKAYDRMPALSPREAGQWMIDAARHRPVRIAPRFGVGARALDIVAPAALNAVLKRQRMQPN